MEKQDDLKNLMRKIKAPLDKAQSAKEIGSIHEAEAFFTHAQKLLEEYQLTIEDLSINDITEYLHPTIFTNEFCEWKHNLANIISKAYNCQVVGRPITNSSKNLQFFGASENIEVCVEIFNFALETYRNAAVWKWNEEFKQLQKIFTQSECDEFQAKKWIIEEVTKMDLVISEKLNPLAFLKETGMITPKKYNVDITDWVLTQKGAEKLGLINRNLFFVSFYSGCLSGLKKSFKKEEEVVKNTETKNSNSLIPIYKSLIDTYINKKFSKLKISSSGGGEIDRGVFDFGVGVGSSKLGTQKIGDMKMLDC